MNGRDWILSGTLVIGFVMLAYIAFVSPDGHPWNPNLMDLCRRFLAFGSAWPLLMG